MKMTERREAGRSDKERENDTVEGGKSWRRKKNEDNSAKIKQEAENSGKSDERKNEDNRV